MNLTEAVLLSCGLLALATPVRADVLTVGPTGQWADIQPALDAAVDGDVLLIAPGTYTGFVIDNLSVTLQADVGGTVVVVGSARIRNLDDQTAVALRGLRIKAGQADHDALVLTNTAGVVHLEECLFKGGKGYIASLFPQGPFVGTEGARLDTCASVIFLRCTLRGGNGSPQILSGPLTTTPLSEGAPALSVVDSSVSLHSCILTGGKGGSINTQSFSGPMFDTPMDGDAGLQASGSMIVMADCTLTGGAGGDGGYGPLIGSGPPSPSILPNAKGGPGLALIGAFSIVRVRETSIEGGQGHESNYPLTLTPPPTVAHEPTLNTANALIISWSAPARSFSMSSPVRKGQSLSLSYSGEAGDTFAFTILSLRPGWALLPGYQGVFALDSMLEHTQFVPLDIHGEAFEDVPVGPLGLGIVGIPAFVQPAFIEASGGITLGSSSMTVLLDDSL